MVKILSFVCVVNTAGIYVSSVSCSIKSNLNCNYRFPFDLAPNGKTFEEKCFIPRNILHARADIYKKIEAYGIYSF